VLLEFRRQLRPLGRRARRRTLAELRDHLLSAVEDGTAHGLTPAESEEQAIRRFGDTRTIATLLRTVRARRRARAVRAVAGAIVAVAVFAIPAVPIANELAPHVAAAASIPVQPNGAVAPRCAASWNSAANARWHAYAKRLGSRRAYVGVAYMGRFDKQKKKMVILVRACTVKLWLAKRPGHWQNAAMVGGPLEGTSVEWGSRMFPKSAKTPLETRQRTTIQFANARVRADGTLVYVGAGIP
jgi:hypothetical protein